MKTMTNEINMHDRMSVLIREIKYKDWELQYALCNGGVLMRWKFEVDGHSWTTRKWYVSKHSTDSEIVQTALKAVLTAEEHEAREHFLYRGRTIFGPHHSVDALLNLPQDVRKEDPENNHEAYAADAEAPPESAPSDATATPEQTVPAEQPKPKIPPGIDVSIEMMEAFSINTIRQLARAIKTKPSPVWIPAVIALNEFRRVFDFIRQSQTRESS